MAISCRQNTDEAFEEAAGELIRFVTSRYNLDAEECYQRFAQLLEARCTQFVNPTRSYICKIKKKYLV